MKKLTHQEAYYKWKLERIAMWRSFRINCGYGILVVGAVVLLTFVCLRNAERSAKIDKAINLSETLTPGAIQMKMNKDGVEYTVYTNAGGLK